MAETEVFIVVSELQLIRRCKLSIETANLDQHGPFADENLREPIASVQLHSYTKENSCNEASAREGRLAPGGPAARRRTEGHIPGERRSFGHTKSNRQVIAEDLSLVKAASIDRNPN